MGESKRRARLDPNYGQIPNLSTTALKDKHSESVLEELFSHFNLELRQLITAQSFPDNYAEVSDRISDWLHHRLLSYRPEDRTYIAQFIFDLISEIENKSVTDQYGRQNYISPIMVCCFLKATKHYFDPESLANFKYILDQSFEQLQQSSSVDLFTQSIIQDMQHQLAQTI